MVSAGSAVKKAVRISQDRYDVWYLQLSDRTNAVPCSHPIKSFSRGKTSPIKCQNLSKIVRVIIEREISFEIWWRIDVSLQVVDIPRKKWPSWITYQVICNQVSKILKQIRFRKPNQFLTWIYFIGTVTAILGPSGAGKSSLLDIISGRTIAKHQGTIMLNGKLRDDSFKTYIGYVTQDER